MTAVASHSETSGTDWDPRDPELRLSQLLDTDSIVALYERDDSGVLAVRGRIGGSPVIAYCTDGTVKGGAMGSAGCSRIVAAIDTAVAEECPVLGVWHSGGARLPEGAEALDAVGQVFAAMIRASGRVPQISVVLGPAAGGAAYGPALTDVVIMAPSGRVFVTGPDVVRSVTGEQIDQDGLGGVDAHGTKSGVVHVVASDEPDAYERARRVTGLLTDQGSFDLDTVETGVEDPGALLPDTARRAYDVKPVIRRILDTDVSGETVFEELQAEWAPNMVTGLGRLGGRAVGVLANNPIRKGGCLDSLSAEKAARFVRMCDAFGVPLVVLVDVPGYLPGVDQEWGGVVRRGAKLLHAFGEAVVPSVTLIMRKSYGGAYIAMNARSLGAGTVLAWPQAEIAVMGARAAVGVLHRKEIAAAPEEEREALQDRLAEEHQRTSGGVDRAKAIGVVDEVIDPGDSRARLARALHEAEPRRGAHGNIPL
ncbi:acetyl-CoA/propionyl-CoA carboxylase carboxyl transferase subunit [Actinopolyspora mzabensis]|uniref:Acetyl-CoA/propionyl-CoA carboxylase carboxyl transferase subunit n=1 Tax=Actinopolyspora mzabensis TaxID=995066 RepID=A0A1G9E0W0_ACTMZ|nr:carboxyl transferase domain-containing protein [Actinopolyspora mzabensis]SDK69756.1 acetyl-CoA/propionyl-CoA carboxylase carboxyl transferase subunit [Actinopolyspora mzabensis]